MLWGAGRQPRNPGPEEGSGPPERGWKVAGVAGQRCPRLPQAPGEPLTWEQDVCPGAGPQPICGIRLLPGCCGDSGCAAGSGTRGGTSQVAPPVGSAATQATCHQGAPSSLLPGLTHVHTAASLGAHGLSMVPPCPATGSQLAEAREPARLLCCPPTLNPSLAHLGRSSQPRAGRAGAVPLGAPEELPLFGYLDSPGLIPQAWSQSLISGLTGPVGVPGSHWPLKERVWVRGRTWQDCARVCEPRAAVALARVSDQGLLGRSGRRRQLQNRDDPAGRSEVPVSGCVHFCGAEGTGSFTSALEVTSAMAGACSLVPARARPSGSSA